MFYLAAINMSNTSFTQGSSSKGDKKHTENASYCY